MVSSFLTTAETKSDSWLSSEHISTYSTEQSPGAHSSFSGNPTGRVDLGIQIRNDRPNLAERGGHPALEGRQPRAGPGGPPRDGPAAAPGRRGENVARYRFTRRRARAITAHVLHVPADAPVESRRVRHRDLRSTDCPVSLDPFRIPNPRQSYRDDRHVRRVVIECTRSTSIRDHRVPYPQACSTSIGQRLSLPSDHLDLHRWQPPRGY